jgi:hypothetical protein
MMYLIYSVKVVDGEKDRSFRASTCNLQEAKHIANCATVNAGADYAYVKEIGGATVFYLPGLSPAVLYDEKASPPPP